MKLRGSVCSEQLETSEVEDLSGYKRDLRKTNFGIFSASNIHPLLGLALLTEALLIALMRADEFLDQGIIDGKRQWMRIMQAIEERERPRDGEAVH